MNPDQAREFIKSHHRGVLATFRKDGRPQLSPIIVGIDDEGMAVISSRENGAYKVRNLRRDPRASVVFSWMVFLANGFKLTVRAEILSLPEAIEPLVIYYRTNSGEHPDWDEYREAMVREKRLLIRILIEQASGPRRSG